MAAIRLKKILTQNSKLIKGYHLLALIQIKNEEWNKARRTLRKAAKIDKTNTTTLRFLREVDEQTGVTTKLDHKGKSFFKGAQTIEDREDSLFGEQSIQPPVYKTRGRASLFFTLMTGFAAGALAFWLLVVPAIRQGIYREANKQIVKYSESLASQGVELSKAQNLAQESGDTMEAAAKQLEEEKKKAASYEALMASYSAMLQENWDEAALKIQQVLRRRAPQTAVRKKAVIRTIAIRETVIRETATPETATPVTATREIITPETAIQETAIRETVILEMAIPVRDIE